MPIGNNTSAHLFDTTFTTNGALYSAASGVLTSTAAGTTGQVLTGNTGSAPTFQTPSVSLVQTTVTITNAEIRALHTTAKTLIAAPGSGIVIVPVSINFKFIYGGTNVFVAADSTYFQYGTTVATNFFNSFASAVMWTGSTNLYLMDIAEAGTNISSANIEDKAITMTADTAITGNAANNNTAKVNIVYYLITI